MIILLLLLSGFQGAPLIGIAVLEATEIVIIHQIGRWEGASEEMKRQEEAKDAENHNR